MRSITKKNKMKRSTPIFALLLLFLSSMPSCIEEINPYTLLPPGRWRGVLHLEQKPVPGKEEVEETPTPRMEDVPYGQLPFLFDLTYSGDSTFYIEIINGEERLRIDDISTWHDQSTGHDSIRINFPIYDTYILGRWGEGIIQGAWFVPSRGKYSIPFEAEFGRGYRFTTVRKKPVMDLSGRWATTFAPDTEDAFDAIGEFKQENNHISGTFATETGDFRFLDGTVQGDKMYLSCFDGSHAFLFTAKVMPDSTLSGTFQSGIHYRTDWIARRDPQATLQHPDSLTFLKPGYERFDFAFPDPETGDTVSIDDAAFAERPKIIQIMGTWCPNCRDETKFLTDYLQKHPDLNIAVIGLSFEKGKDPEKAFKLIRTFKQKMKVPYPILYAGPPGAAAAEALPMLQKIVSYPTMIFLDKDNRVLRIHTGFYGPATTEYRAFTEEFDEYIRQLNDQK